MAAGESFVGVLELPITVNNAHVPVTLFSRQIASPMRSYCGAFRFVEARPEGPDLFVRYIRVMPFDEDRLDGRAVAKYYAIDRLLPVRTSAP